MTKFQRFTEKQKILKPRQLDVRQLIYYWFPEIYLSKNS